MLHLLALDIKGWMDGHAHGVGALTDPPTTLYPFYTNIRKLTHLLIEMKGAERYENRERRRLRCFLIKFAIFCINTKQNGLYAWAGVARICNHILLYSLVNWSTGNRMGDWVVMCDVWWAIGGRWRVKITVIALYDCRVVAYTDTPSYRDARMHLKTLTDERTHRLIDVCSRI